MLTRKQIELLELIHTRMQQDGVAPSFDEMKDALSLRSKSGIHRLISALEERGFIRRLPHRARAIEVLRLPGALAGGAAGRSASVTPLRPTPEQGDVGAQEPVATVPVMGRIAAGTPIEAISSVSHSIGFPASMLSGKADHFALEVQGESMIDLGINDGDIVIIRRQDTAENGDVVVALVDGHEATLKKFRRSAGRIALEAANPAFETRILRDDRVEVQGRLVGLIRSY